jgi:hypothetical protein
MGLGWTNYSISCCDCGNTGSVSIWTDDWYRWQSKWKGFRGRSIPTGPRLETMWCNRCKRHNIEVTREEQESCFPPVDVSLSAPRLNLIRKHT